ncbi:MAG: tetratricopeptide repeat protein [bacterium]|nr:tetratricopeptide repeat protein [bacterium]
MAEEKIEGIYYEEKTMTGGLHANVRYWAREDGDVVILEYLKLTGTSTGMEAEKLTREAFEKRFTKEESKEEEVKKTPEEEHASKLARQGQIHLEKKEYFSAQYEFQNALKVDGTHVQASFGLGQAYLESGDVEKAKEIFDQLGDNTKLYEKENKHTLNDLGIVLRKQQMYDAAISNYRKAIEIDAKDPVLYFNLGRAFWHKGNRGDALDNLRESIKLDPDFEHAKEFMQMVEKKK